METNNTNYLLIQQYLEGSLDEKTMHELEKRALDDPFLADALEGYARLNTPAQRQLSLLQLQLEERIARQQENKNTYNFSWQRLSIATAAGLLFVIVSILFWFKSQQRPAKQNEVEVSLTPVSSRPVEGWKAYQEYLEKSAAVARGKVQAGNVTLSFSIRNNELSDIQVLRGLDDRTNEEAVRILKEGPKWQAGHRKTGTVTIEFE